MAEGTKMRLFNKNKIGALWVLVMLANLCAVSDVCMLSCHQTTQIYSAIPPHSYFEKGHAHHDPSCPQGCEESKCCEDSRVFLAQSLGACIKQHHIQNQCCKFFVGNRIEAVCLASSYLMVEHVILFKTPTSFPSFQPHAPPILS